MAIASLPGFELDSDAWTERIALVVGLVLSVLSSLLSRAQIRATRKAQRAALEIGETQAALRRSEEQFREITENINEVVWVTGGDGIQLEYVSPAYETVWGRPRDVLLKNPLLWVESIHADDRERILAALPLAATGLYDARYRIVRPDGAVRWIRDRASPIRDASGNCIRVVGTAADITDLHEAQEALLANAEQLRQAQKMEAVGRLAGGIAHDFNNLLTVIGGFGHMALDMPELDEAPSKCVRQMVRASDRAAELTQQLLAFSRKQVLQPTVLDVNSVFEKLAPMLRRMIGEDVELTLALAPNAGRVRADRGQIEQVVTNLAVNGRDAMPDGGKITLATQIVEVDAESGAGCNGVRPGRYVQFSVTDSGSGMSPETLGRLFEPFFTTKEAGKGTGLGLATSYGIVKQSGGHIEVESELGRGSTFRVHLPLVDEAVSVKVRVSPSPVPSGSETVLLVEDDAGVRTLTAHVLTGAGYRVIEAESGEAGLTAAHAHSGVIDLVLTDTVMPGMNGRQFADRLLETRPGSNVLFMSGYTDDAIVRHGVLEQAIQFLEKPFTPAKLLAKVRAVLDRHRPAVSEAAVAGL